MKKDNTERYTSIFKNYGEIITSTLGPEGRYVAFSDSGEITKDGATVARNLIKIAEKKEEVFMSMMLEDLTKSANRNADGTTTATVLATAMLDSGIEDLDSLVERVVKGLKEMSIEDKSKLRDIINTSGHEATNELVEEAYNETDSVSVVTSMNTECSMEITRGIKLSTPLFTGFESISSLKDAFIILYEGDIQYMSDITPLLEQYNDQKKANPLVVIARSFSEEIHGFMQTIYNNSNGEIAILPVSAPWRGSALRDYFMDVASLTGGRFIEAGSIDRVTFGDVAGVADVGANSEGTTLSNLKPRPEAEARYNAITDKLKTATGYNKKELEERKVFFQTKHADVIIGAKTISEANEIYTRTLDSVGSAREFLKGGYVIGGGLSYMAALPNYTELEAIVVTAPYKKICENAGKEVEVGNDVVDATNTVINSIQTAASLAKTIRRIKYIL